jgi:4'-phosphopantetheinyl transferase
MQAAKMGFAEVHVWRLEAGPTREDTREDVRGILSSYADLPPTRIEFRSSRRGRRPRLANGICPGLSFNLAHSGREALLAVTRGRRVGVDIERARPLLRLDRLIRRFFSDREAEGLLRLGREEREAAFFRTWVRKEAYLKAVGGGVPAGLRRFSVSVDPDVPPSIRSTGLEDGGVSLFSLCDLDVPEGHAGAVAVEGTGHRIRYFDGACAVGEEQRRRPG